MGLVWAGRHGPSGLPVAVKVMTARQFRRPGPRRALANEIRAASVLCHPGIALLFDQGLVDAAAEEASGGRVLAGSPYVAMELVSGGTLGEQPPDRWSRLRRVLMELLAALAHAHARDIVHRDLKPSNVLVAAEGDLRSGVRLTDWGIARALQEDGGANAGLGTVHYMAPEQILGQWRDQGPWTDLYSLGCMAFRLAAGRRPAGSEGPTSAARAHIEGRLQPFEPWMPVPLEFDRWLDGLMAREPGARFQRAADAAQALADLGQADDLAPSDAPLEPFGLRALTRRETLPGFVTDGRPHALVDASATSTFSMPALLSDELPAADDLEAGSPQPAPLSADWRPEPGRPPLPLLVGAGLGLVGLRPPPLVGRLRLRDRLWQRLVEVARGGSAGVVLLSGEPGCGKTRLADWLVDRADELGAATALRVDHHADGGPGHGLRPALQRALGLQDLPAEDAARRCAAFCRARGAGDESEGEALAELLRGPAGSQPRAARLALLQRALLRLAAPRPLVLRLDDLQWGPQTLDVVVELLDGPPLPVLIVATWRQTGELDDPRESPHWPRLAEHPQVEWLEVPPLPPHDQEALLDGLLGLEPALRRAVLERSAGTPLFAVELVSDEVRRGRLEPGPQGWRLRPGQPRHLPDGLHALWLERSRRALVGLHPDAEFVLELAATLGQDIEERELRAVTLAAGLQPVPALGEALQTHNLATSTPQGLRLAHALLRESLLRHARDEGRHAGWHAFCADALHRLHGQRGPRTAERIGRHLLAAGRTEACLAPLLDAAEQRRDRGDAEHALALLQERAAALDALGQRGEAFAEGQVVEARVAGNRADFERVAALCGPIVQQATAEGWTRVAPEAMRTLAFAWWQQGRCDEAEALYADALTRFRALEQPLGIGRCELGLGIAAYQRGDLDGAELRFERARRGFAEGGVLRGVVDALGWAGILSRRRGHNGEALQRFEDAVGAAESGGLRFAANAVRNSLGVTLRSQGRLAEADAVFQQVLAEAELLGSGEAVWPCINLGLLRLEAGEPGRASSLLHRALRMLEDSGRVTFQGGVRVALLACAGALGDWEAWTAEHDAALSALERSPVPHPDIAATAERAAEHAQAAGRPAEARQALAIAEAQWSALGDADAVDRVRDRLALLRR